MTEYQLSYFKNLSDKPQTVFLTHIVETIKGQNLKNAIEGIRNLSDKKERDQLKKSLPSVCVSGIFEGTRQLKDLKEHTGIMQIDVDHVENIPEVLKVIKSDQFTFVCFVSPSGTGIKIFVKIEANKESHKDYFLALEKYYKETYSIEIDPKCKDISRLCFLSYDPDLYQNNESLIFPLPVQNTAFETIKTPEIKPIETQSKPTFQKNDLLDIEKVIKQIENQKLDITKNQSDWLAIGYSFADFFGMDGLAYFQRVSKFYPGYNSIECETTFKSCFNNKKNKGISPFFAIAKRLGLDTISVGYNSKNKPESKTDQPKETALENFYEALPRDSKNPSQDYKENGFFLKKGCYYKLVKTNSHNQLEEQISTFVMSFVYHVDDGSNNTKRLVKLQRKTGEMWFVEVYSNELRKDAFDPILKSKSCSFFGSSTDFQKVLNPLMDNERNVKAVSCLGYNYEGDFYAFADCIINKTNELKKINDLGIIEDNHKSYYLPYLAKTTINDSDKYINQRFYKYLESEYTFTRYSELLYKAFEVNGCVILLFFILSLFRDIVFNQKNYFPFLFLFGQENTGKTAIVRSILNLLGRSLIGDSLTGTTSPGLSRLTTQRIVLIPIDNQVVT